MTADRLGPIRQEEQALAGAVVRALKEARDRFGPPTPVNLPEIVHWVEARVRELTGQPYSSAAAFGVLDQDDAKARASGDRE